MIGLPGIPPGQPGPGVKLWRKLCSDCAYGQKPRSPRHEAAGRRCGSHPRGARGLLYYLFYGQPADDACARVLLIICTSVAWQRTHLRTVLSTLSGTLPPPPSTQTPPSTRLRAAKGALGGLDVELLLPQD